MKRDEKELKLYLKHWVSLFTPEEAAVLWESLKTSGGTVRYLDEPVQLDMDEAFELLRKRNPFLDRYVAENKNLGDR